MSASDRVIKLTLDVQTKISDLESGVSRIKKEFASLKAPEALTNDVKKSFDDLQERLVKVKEYTKNNTLNLADKNKVAKELKAIEGEYENLFRRINVNASKISWGTANKEAQALSDSIEKYESSIKKATKAYAEQGLTVQRLQKDLEKADKEFEKFKNSEDRKSTLQTLDKFEQDAKVAKEAYDEANNKLKEQQKIFDALNEKIKRYKEEHTKLKKVDSEGNATDQNKYTEKEIENLLKKTKLYKDYIAAEKDYQ